MNLVWLVFTFLFVGTFIVVLSILAANVFYQPPKKQILHGSIFVDTSKTGSEGSQAIKKPAPKSKGSNGSVASQGGFSITGSDSESEKSDLEKGLSKVIAKAKRLKNAAHLAQLLKLDENMLPKPKLSQEMENKSITGTKVISTELSESRSPKCVVSHRPVKLLENSKPFAKPATITQVEFVDHES